MESGEEAADEIDHTPWEVHRQALDEWRSRETAEREALFMSGPAPDWSKLPDVAWELIVDYLGARNGPSGAANLYYAFLGCGKAFNLRNLLEGRHLRVGGNDAAVITIRGGEVEISLDRSQEVRQLCEAVPVEELQLGSFFPAEELLQRSRFQELHADKLRRLDCALGDLSILQHFPRLESLSPRQVQRGTPWAAGVLAADQLAVLQLLPELHELLFNDFKEVKLQGVRLPSLKVLKIFAPMLEGVAQEALQYSLPEAQLRGLEVCGPIHSMVDDELQNAPFDTPLDLMAAADCCERIVVQCRSLVLEDSSGEFEGAPPHVYAAEALRRGRAWRSVTWTLTRGEGGGGQAVHVLSQGGLEGTNLDELQQALQEELGPSVCVEVSGAVKEAGVCWFKMHRDAASDSA